MRKYRVIGVNFKGVTELIMSVGFSVYYSMELSKNASDIVCQSRE